MPIMKKTTVILSFISAVICLFFLWQMYVPKTLTAASNISYTVQKGMGEKAIAEGLKQKGLIKSKSAFRFYVFISGEYKKLQAGEYELSPSMNTAQIAEKIASGDVVRHQVTIIEGWEIQDIAAYLEQKGFSSKEDFIKAAQKDWSQEFSFLKTKPKNLSLEGYLFPDTYETYKAETAEDLVRNMLSNFESKLTPAMQNDIAAGKTSLFKIITMASIVEREVQTPEDKKIVAGILWKRLSVGMPLQADSTINYITHTHNPKTTVKDTQINSPYNTYRYYGLPLGPISNPGLDSIMAAIYPTKTEYWYYLSADKTGKTIFSKTLQEQEAAQVKYFGS